MSNLIPRLMLIRSEIIISLSLVHNEIEGSELCDESRGVAVNVAGYAARKIMNRVGCDNCPGIPQSNKVPSDYGKFHLEVV